MAKENNMNDKLDFGNIADNDDLTVIDATVEENRVNVVDLTLGDDDSDDDIYDGYYDEKIDEPYYVAIKSVVFGSLAIIFPMFAWLFSLFNTLSLMAVAAAVTGFVFSIVGLISVMRCTSAPRGSLSQGLARAGRCIGIIGLIVSSIILTVILFNFIISVLVILSIIVFYLAVCLVGLLGGLIAFIMGFPF